MFAEPGKGHVPEHAPRKSAWPRHLVDALNRSGKVVKDWAFYAEAVRIGGEQRREMGIARASYHTFRLRGILDSLSQACDPYSLYTAGEDDEEGASAAHRAVDAAIAKLQIACKGADCPFHEEGTLKCMLKRYDACQYRKIGPRRFCDHEDLGMA